MIEIEPPIPFEAKVGLTTGAVKVLKFFLDRSKDSPGEYFRGVDAVKRVRLETGVVYPILKRLEREAFLESKEVDKTEVVSGPRRSYRLYRITKIGVKVAEEALAAFNDEMTYWANDKLQKAAPEMLEVLGEVIAYWDRPADTPLPREDWYKVTPQIGLKIRSLFNRLTKERKIENMS